MSMTPAKRLLLHRGMIDLLRADATPDLATLAHHAVQAGAVDLIIEYAPLAAAEAIDRGSRKEAIAFYKAALAHSDRMSDDMAADLRFEMASQLAIAEAAETAYDLEQVDLVVAHHRSKGDALKLASALRLRQTYLWALRRIPEAWEAIDEAIQVLRPLGPTHELGMCLYRAAHLHMLARHRNPALEAVREAESVGRKLEDEEVIWLTLMMRGTIELVVGNAHIGATLLTRAWRQAEAMNNSRLIQIALSMLGSGAGEARLYETASTALEESISQGLATDEDYSVAYSRAWLARIAFEQGRWDEAVQYAQLVERASSFREGIAYRTAIGAGLGRVRVRRGDPGGLHLLNEMRKAGMGGELQHVWPAICGIAEYHWLQGEAERMLEVLDGAYKQALDTDSQWARGELGFWMWKAGGIDTPPEGAARPFALQMSGAWQQAAEAWRDLGAPYEEGMALLDGDHTAVAAAIEIFDTLGAAPASSKARIRLRELGVSKVPPRRTIRDGVAGLTPRQAEVLALLADGMSNSEIAEELFVSKKTVEHHVSAILTHFGVSSRAKAIQRSRLLEGVSQDG
jgi:ATP/maltotriose-dependent transcriptional regulator MalT